MIRATSYGVAVFALIALLGCNPANIKPIEGGNTLGVVLLHGKGGDTRWVNPLASNLRSAGVQVAVPDMPWHRNRIYDKSFDDSLAEISGYVGRLKANGAQKVFVAGHSLGAIAAAGYGARVGGIQGIILLAPGHFVGFHGFSRHFSGDLDKADAMIRSGKGNDRGNFGDINAGQRDTRYVSANIYRSWFSPRGPADFVENMSKLQEGVSVLYVAGSRDRIPQTQNSAYAFEGAPKNSSSRFVMVDADHLDVPARSGEVVVEWLRGQ